MKKRTFAGLTVCALALAGIVGAVSAHEAARVEADQTFNLSIEITVTNFDGTTMQKPQLVWKSGTGEYNYLNNLVQDTTDPTKFTSALANVSGTISCHVATWGSTDPWPEYDYFATGGVDYTFEMTSDGTLTASGAFGLAAEKAVGTYEYSAGDVTLPDPDHANGWYLVGSPNSWTWSDDWYTDGYDDNNVAKWLGVTIAEKATFAFVYSNQDVLDWGQAKRYAAMGGGGAAEIFVNANDTDQNFKCTAAGVYDIYMTNDYKLYFEVHGGESSSEVSSSQAPVSSEESSAESAEEGDITVYFRDAEWWAEDGARTSVYLWGGSAEATTWPGNVMTKVETKDGLNVWKYTLNTAEYKNVIFARYAATDTDSPDWGAKSVDIDLSTFDPEKPLYDISGQTEAIWGDPGVTGTWTAYEEPAASSSSQVSSEESTESSVSEKEYFLVGSFNDWKIGDENYKFEKMGEQKEGKDQYKLEFTTTEAETAIKVNDGANWYPEGMGNEYTIADAGDYTIYFVPEGVAAEDWHEGFFYVAKADPTPSSSETPVSSEESSAEPVDQYIYLGTGDGYASEYLYTWDVATKTPNAEWPGIKINEIEGAYVTEGTNFAEEGGIWKIPLEAFKDMFIVVAYNAEAEEIKSADLATAAGIYAAPGWLEASPDIGRQAAVTKAIEDKIVAATDKSVCNVGKDDAKKLVEAYDALEFHDKVDAATYWTYDLDIKDLTSESVPTINVTYDKLVEQLRNIADSGKAGVWNIGTTGNNLALIVTISVVTVGLAGAGTLYLISKKRRLQK